MKKLFNLYPIHAVFNPKITRTHVSSQTLSRHSYFVLGRYHFVVDVRYTCIMLLTHLPVCINKCRSRGYGGCAQGVSSVGARGAHCRPSPEKQVSIQPPLTPLSLHRMRSCTAFALSFRENMFCYTKVTLAFVYGNCISFVFRCYEGN